MSDVRSLLRDERAARRVNHPQAQYTSAGLLICKACRIQVRSETLWQSHLISAQHVDTLKRLAAGLQTQSKPSAGTKRKADDDSEVREEELAFRKRLRGEDGSEKRHVHFEEPQQAPSPPAESFATEGQSAIRTTKQEINEEATTRAGKPTAQAEVNEDEWAAFERDVATPPPERRPDALTPKAVATIVAAPMTAAEIAAKSREEESTQAKERRDAEIEGEKEDAIRRLEEEFDQMEELEGRVKRLKEQREALRTRMLQSSNDPSETVVPAAEDNEQSEDDDSDFDDGWNTWGRS